MIHTSPGALAHARRRALRGPRVSLLLLAVVSLLTTGVVQAGPKEVVVNGVPHVQNAATPTNGVQALKLKELWRAGGDTDDEVFGVVLQVLLDEQGNIYLLDSQLSQAVVYSPAGQRLRTLGREGEGPGEVRRPSDALFMPDGSLGFVQTFPGKVIKVARDGTPAGTFQPGGESPTQGGFAVLIDGQQQGGTLVFSGISISMTEGKQTRTNYLCSFTADGKETARYLEKVNTLDFNKPTIIEKEQHFVYPRRWTLAPDGHVYAAPHRNQYAINVYAQDGKLERVIERAFTSRQRTAEESARVQRLLEAQTRQSPIKFTLQAESTEPDISSLRFQEGHLWVLSSRSTVDQPAGVFATYDVFTPEGEFTRQVAVACAGDGENDGLFLTEDGHAVMVTGLAEALMAMQGAGEDESEGAAPMEVVYYEVLK